MNLGFSVTFATLVGAMYLVVFLLLVFGISREDGGDVDSNYRVVIPFAALWPLIFLHYIYYRNNR